MEKYDNLGVVGEGSYGIVMKCRHKATSTLVAIKKFLDSDDDKTVKRIANREIKMLKQLRHENLVSLIEIFKRRKKLYIVFEFVDYTLLDDLEKNPSGLESNYARKLLFQILRGIEYCHNNHVIHRDIKPENILVSKSGVIKLCDFGFARLVSGKTNSFTDYVATRWYRAPELLVGDTKYGKPVDIWAIGCLTSEMFAGDPLFPGDSDIDQLFHIVRCIGFICPKHIEIFKKNPLLKGVQIPECNESYSLEKRYPKMNKSAIKFIKRCLDPTPEDRPTCTQLLTTDFFPGKYSELLSSQIKMKVQKEREKNPLLKNLLSSNPNTNNDNSSTKTLSKPHNQKRPSLALSKTYSNLNNKIKNNINNQLSNNEGKNNVNEIYHENQDNEIMPVDKNIIIAEDSWEGIQLLTSKKERVASRAGRYQKKNEENIKEEEIFQPDETNISEINIKIEIKEISRQVSTIDNESFVKNKELEISSKQELQNKISLSPRNLEILMHEKLNKVSKPTKGASIPMKNNENGKMIIELSPPTDMHTNPSSPTPTDIVQSHSQSHQYQMNLKKTLPVINKNFVNGNFLQSKILLNTFNTIHKQVSIPFHSYLVRQNSNNFQHRNIGFPSDSDSALYLPHVGKEYKFRQQQNHIRNVFPQNKPSVQFNSHNTFKSIGPTKERSGFYYNLQNKSKSIIINRQNTVCDPDHTVSLPELKGSEMSIIKTQITNANPKYKYLNPRSNFVQNEFQTIGKLVVYDPSKNNRFI